MRGNIRRFALVACAVTGALTWVSIPLELHVPRASFALAGLVAAIISAASPRSPRWLAHPFAFVVLSGCIAFALPGFAAPAAGDLAAAGVDVDFFGGWLVLLWLLAAGALSRLLIAELKPGHAYAGTLLGMASIIVFISPTIGAGMMLGLAAFFAAVPTLLAAWATDRVMRLGAPVAVPVPAARVVQLDRVGDGGIAEGTSSGD